jgi:hypothetical protein
MQSKVRSAALSLVLAGLVAGCAAHHADAKLAAGSGFTTEQARQLACLDLRDHIVSLYADAYAEDEGMSLSAEQRTAFRSGWAEQLAKRGTFERFEQSCFFSLTPRKYECGMASRSTDGLVACMKLSARDVPSSEMQLHE